MWNALNRIGNASCITSTVRLARWGDKNFACAKPTPAMSSRTVRPPICVCGSRIACSNESTLLRNTFSTTHLYGSQFSDKKENELKFRKVEKYSWKPLTNTENVYDRPASITVGQCVLHLHSQNVMRFRRRRHTKQIRRFYFHFEIILHLEESEPDFIAMIPRLSAVVLMFTIRNDLSTSNFFTRKNLKRKASSRRAFGIPESPTIKSFNCRSFVFRVSASSPSSCWAFCCHSISTQNYRNR